MTSSRLRRHNLCPNILESGLVGCSTVFLEPTSLRGSQWPLGQTRTKRSDLHRVSEDAHWPKLVVGQLTVKKTIPFIKKSKRWNIMWHSQWPILGEVHPRKKFINNLAWSSFKRGGGIRNIATFPKFLITSLQAIYLIRFSKSNRNFQTRNCDIISQLRISVNFFKKCFFHSAISEWSTLDMSICNSDNILAFKTKLLKFVRPILNSILICHIPKERNVTYVVAAWFESSL